MYSEMQGWKDNKCINPDNEGENIKDFTRVYWSYGFKKILFM